MKESSKKYSGSKYVVGLMCCFAVSNMTVLEARAFVLQENNRIRAGCRVVGACASIADW